LQFETPILFDFKEKKSKNKNSGKKKNMCLMDSDTNAQGK